MPTQVPHRNQARSGQVHLLTPDPNKAGIQDLQLSQPADFQSLRGHIQAEAWDFGQAGRTVSLRGLEKNCPPAAQATVRCRLRARCTRMRFGTRNRCKVMTKRRRAATSQKRVLQAYFGQLVKHAVQLHRRLVQNLKAVSTHTETLNQNLATRRQHLDGATLQEA
jgi:hypothetical protein